MVNRLDLDANIFRIYLFSHIEKAEQQAVKSKMYGCYALDDMKRIYPIIKLMFLKDNEKIFRYKCEVVRH